ncbi:MAG: hypothetical protein ABI462_06465 [Ignavibacteria bacterium]
MKHLFIYLLPLLSIQLYSCSSDLFNSPSQINGTWISILTRPGEFDFRNHYYSEFIFKQDSFFVEIISKSEDLDEGYSPFKAKGTYKITGDRIKCKGVDKPENSERFDYPYNGTYVYTYDPPHLTLTSLSDPLYQIFTLIKRYPDGH